MTLSIGSMAWLPRCLSKEFPVAAGFEKVGWWRCATLVHPVLISSGGSVFDLEGVARVHKPSGTRGRTCWEVSLEAWPEALPEALLETLLAAQLTAVLEAPVEALRALAGIGNPRRMGVPGVEVARHRVKCFEKGDVEMVGGWRDARPALMVEVGRTADRAGHWAVDQGYTPRLVERGAARAAHPFLLGLFAGATSPSRRAMLELVRLRGHDVDERWLWTVAAVEAGAGARNDRVSAYLWRACVSTRCAPQSFAEAQYLGIRNQRISAWVASLRCHEDARRFGAAMPPVTVSGDGLDDHVYVGGPFLTGVVNGNLLAWLAIECKQAAALARRARDPRWWVRAAVAMNLTVDAALREQLCGDHHWVVRGMAREAREAAGRVAAASGAAA